MLVDDYFSFISYQRDPDCFGLVECHCYVKFRLIFAQKDEDIFCNCFHCKATNVTAELLRWRVLKIIGFHRWFLFCFDVMMKCWLLVLRWVSECTFVLSMSARVVIDHEEVSRKGNQFWVFFPATATVDVIISHEPATLVLNVRTITPGRLCILYEWNGPMMMLFKSRRLAL